MPQKAKPNRKSQSALEYMMTYGWAILIIVIVAGVLYSLGIFTPSSSASPTVTGFNGLGSPNAMCMSDGGLRLQLGNSLGYTINVTKINVTSNSVTQTIRPNQTISPDGTYIFYVPNVCGSASGAKYSFTSSVTYTEPGQPIFGPFYSNGAASGTVSSLVNPGYVLYVNNLAHATWEWALGSTWFDAGGLSYMNASTTPAAWTSDRNYTLTMWILSNYNTSAMPYPPPPNSSSFHLDGESAIFSFTSQDTMTFYTGNNGNQIFMHRCNSADTAIHGRNVSVSNILDDHWHFVAVAVHAPSVSSGIFNSNYYMQFDNGYGIANNSNGWGSQSPIRIGTSTNQCDNGLFTGYISNVQLYGQTLSSSQIYQIYREGIFGTPLLGNSLTSWWPLNGTTNDYSGNGHTGNLHNASITSNYPVEQIGG